MDDEEEIDDVEKEVIDIDTPKKRKAEDEPEAKKAKIDADWVSEWIVEQQSSNNHERDYTKWKYSSIITMAVTEGLILTMEQHTSDTSQ